MAGTFHFAMHRSEYRIPWGRLAVEGSVIVASILLAFAIDAWWETKQKKEADKQQIARVAAELQISTMTLDRSIEVLNESIRASSTILSRMGPTDEISKFQDIGEQFVQMFAVGMPSLTRNATKDFLASGVPTSSDFLEVRAELSRFLSSSEELLQEYAYLRQIRIRLTEYLQTNIPTLHLMASHPLMEEHQTSKFPLNTEIILTDPNAESMIAEYEIRVKIIRDHALDLRVRQVALTNLIESMVDN